ncbi:hypothetical protein C823_001274 [Eubacterium plexicaudatum ASF492]|nr:hypothetical protein C823_001274 [Eubacterium plexicaudatum ASF492]
MNKNFISILDISKSEILNLFQTANKGRKIFQNILMLLKKRFLVLYSFNQVLEHN